MSTFVDTSALYAVLAPTDSHHERATQLWRGLATDASAGQEELVTTNYVLVEAFALVQRRLGLDALQALINGAIPLLRVHWVGSDDHDAGLIALLAERKARGSVVDAVSFVAMRRLGINRAFAFDGDFESHGFETL